ncbi:MAG: M28 family peptidase [Promethearchaeota archaeon]
MIDENKMEQNLNDFSFPRLSGTSFEKKALNLARDKIRELGLNPLEQKFEFSTFYSRIYPKIAFISGFLLLLIFYLNLETPIFPVVIILIFSILIILFILMRKPEKYKLYKKLKSANLYVKVPSKNSSTIKSSESKNIFIFMCHLDSKSQKLTILVRVRAMRAWVFTSLILIIIIILKNLIFPYIALIFYILGFIPMIINTFSTVLIEINTTNNLSPGATDNASGIICVYELLKFFSKTEGKLENLDTWFVFTGCEETGTMGIRHFNEIFKNIDRDSIIFVNFDSIGNYCTIFDSIYKPEGYDEFYNSFLNNNRGIKIFEKSKRINFGTHSDGTYIKKKKYKGIEFGDLSVYKYMHSAKDTIEKVDVHKLKLLCEVIIDNMNELDKS